MYRPGAAVYSSGDDEYPSPSITDDDDTTTAPRLVFVPKYDEVLDSNASVVGYVGAGVVVVVLGVVVLTILVVVVYLTVVVVGFVGLA